MTLKLLLYLNDDREKALGPNPAKTIYEWIDKRYGLVPRKRGRKPKLQTAKNGKPPAEQTTEKVPCRDHRIRGLSFQPNCEDCLEANRA